MNQDITFLGFIWVQGGVGVTLLAARDWRRLNFSGPTTASFFSKIDKKTNNAHKKCTRTQKKYRVPAGPKKDATLTEKIVDATVKF